ncbi:calcium/sodium antiporter [Halobaculum roseum]|uniref:Calcium/sodium antiporter n=1 Tax=Halobaculum roseum TaxID=2175149 RepID=A0ABD5MRB0_9EURY|nr:calcium/sodium antiporter [Halobaculum roseum]QZY02256.1 calcium/sodium antiporter [Halobaculum roseum]
MVQGGPLVQVGIVVLSVLGLWIGARLLVDAVVRLARRFGLSELAIGLTVVAMGTSTPELSVSLDAAANGLGDIAVANVLGSNVYNLAFILGVVALIRVIPIAETLVHRDGLALLASTAVGGIALVDLAVSRVEGAVLAGLFVTYTAYLLRAEGGSTVAGAGTEDEEPEVEPEAGSAPSDVKPGSDPGTFPGDAATTDITGRVSFRGRDALLLVGGLALVLVSGDYMVAAASTLARGAGISEWVIGGTIVAAGTSTPEFAVSLVALSRGSLGVSVGNVVGSNVFNITGIMGAAALVRPLAVSANALETLAWLAGVTVLMVAALWTGRQLSRPEGALFAGSEIGRWVLGLFGLLG